MTVTEVTDTTSVSGKVIKKFTTDLAAGGGQDTTTWVCPLDVTSVLYLVVGGGGGGGSGYSGGGGGGGALYTGTLDVTPGQSYTVKVGAGGTRGIAHATDPFLCTSGGNGAASQFDSIIAPGGGYGAGGIRTSGGNGGCGGGNSGSQTGGGGGSGGTGNPGKNGGTSTAAYGGGSGGGGMSTAGQSGNVCLNYDNNGTKISLGGTGVASSITGTSVTYCKGGNGRCHYSGSSGSAGAANTGNGGDGGAGIPYMNGRVGGSGVVILQYNTPTILVRSGVEWL